jgi:hypothetical protein
MPEIWINRAPFLTLWASVVARRLGYDDEASLTLGRAVAGQTAAAKGKRLGIAESRSGDKRRAILEERQDLGTEGIQFMDRTIPCVRTASGLRALADARPIDPASVHRYLCSKFGEDLALVEGHLVALAAAFPPAELEAQAMDLYMRMRPVVASGTAGWGQQGRLDTEAIDRLCPRGARSTPRD